MIPPFATIGLDVCVGDSKDAFVDILALFDDFEELLDMMLVPVRMNLEYFDNEYFFVLFQCIYTTNQTI